MARTNERRDYILWLSGNFLVTGAVRVPAGGGRRSDAACPILFFRPLCGGPRAAWSGSGTTGYIASRRRDGYVSKIFCGIGDQLPATSSSWQRDWGGCARVTGRGEIESATGLSGVGETSPAASRWARGRPRDCYSSRCTLMPTTTFNHLLVIHSLWRHGKT